MTRDFTGICESVLSDHRGVPRYDVRCPEHGVHEVFRKMSGDEPFYCEIDPECDQPVVQDFTNHRFYASIEAADAPSSDPQRVKDGTSEFNLGLPGVDTVVGTRADGKPKLAYRPLTHNEVGTNRNMREIAKRNGLIPMERGSFRAIGK